MTLLTEPTRIVLAKGQPVPNDQNFAFNSLLLHGDGTNGSTVITDSSGSPKAVTAFGNAQISTAQSKFGGASIAFDGTGDYLTSSSSPTLTFGTGDFTVECWARPADTSAGYRALLSDNLYGNANGWALYQNGTSLEAWVSGVYLNVITATSALTASVWQHVVWSRASGDNRCFVNGVQVGSTVSNSHNLIYTFASIGRVQDGLHFNGHLDEVRYTKGIARYTANFTPPTAPFPDF